MTPPTPGSLRRAACAFACLLVFATPLWTRAQSTPVGVANRIVEPIREDVRVVLPGYVAPEANSLNDRGAAPDSMPLEQLHLVLRRSAGQEAALKQLIADENTPGSANYHKWLTPAQFGEEFGPSAQDIATVENWLSSHGFAVEGVEPGKQVIAFSGNVSELRNAFGVQIHRYLTYGAIHYAAANNPEIPAALAPVVGGFVTLNNFRPKLNDRVLGTATYNPKTDRATPSWTYGNATRGLSFVVSPGDFGEQYDVPTGSAEQGQGESIAILDFSNINVAMVERFRSLFGLPTTNLPQVVIDGNDPGIDGVNNPDGPFPGSAIESYLDVEWAGAVAPQATIYLVIAADTALENGGILAAEHAVDSDLAPIISSSIDVGGCEANAGSLNSFMSSLWEQAAAEGITVVVAAGDNGSAGCDNENTEAYAENGLGVNSWASTPYNVAVGGTDFYYSDYKNLTGSDLSEYWNLTATQNPETSLLRYIPEQPWNDSQYGDDAVDSYDVNGETDIIAGSGGASSAGVCSGNDYSTTTGECLGTLSGYAKPAWQTGFGSGSVRDIPDVSLFAADGYNYSYYPICGEDGDCETPSGSNLWQITGVGGTSAAAPTFAAIMALVDQQYGPQGQADFVLYPLKTQYPAAFHDITAGSNSVPCAEGSSNCIPVADPIVYGGTTEGQIGTGTTADYNAAAGYNLATGLGSVDASQLIADWGKVSFQSTQTTLTSPTADSTYTHGSAVTIQGAVAASTGNTPAGSVAIMSDSATPLAQGLGALALSSGAFDATTYSLPGGTYNLWAEYSGDGTNGPSSSGKVEITVSPEASTSYFNVVNTASSLSGRTAITSGASVPYGTQLMLDDQIFGSDYYNQCFIGGSNAAMCQNYDRPTGTVSFADRGATINTAVLNAEGDAEYNAAFGVGSHAVTSSYSGDASYQASSGSAIDFTVTQDTPDILLSAPGQSSSSSFSFATGQADAIEIQVENTANASLENSEDVAAVVPIAAPTGTVTVTGLPGGTQTVALMPAVDPTDDFADGVATVTVPSSGAAGNYTMGVSYSGDGNYTAASGSGAVTLSAPTLLPSTTAASMTGSIAPNSSITVTGTVSGPAGDPAPTGGVTFYSSGNALGSVAFSSSTGNISSFSVSLNSEDLFEGTNFITVQYAGDSRYGASQAALNSTGVGNPLWDFSMLPESATVAVTAGSSGTDVLQLYSVNGFAGTVNYTCAAATGVTCGIAPNSNTFAANGTASATVTVSAGSTTANGSYDVVVTGTDSSGEYVHTVGLTAMVTGSAATGAIVLSNSGSINVMTGSSGTSTLTVTPQNGFTGQVDFSCSMNGAPAGVTCSAPAVSISGTAAATSTLTVDAASTATAGSYTATVVASDAATGKVTSSTTVPVTVTQSAVPSFTLDNSGSISIAAGSSGISTLTVTPANGFTGGVSFSCTIAGSASGLTCSAPATTISGTTAATSTLTVAAGSATAAGNYTATVTASDEATGTVTSSVTVSITVTAAPPSPSFTLSNSGNISVTAGSSGTSTLTVTPGNGFTGAVNISCTIAGAPTGLSCSAPQATISGTSSATSTLSVAATSSAAAGSYTATVIATDAATGTISSSTTVSITVAAAASPSFALSNSGNISVGAGSSGTSTISVTPANGFAGTVNLSCAVSGAASGVGCSLSPNSADVTSGAVTSTLTVSTTASSAALRFPLKKLVTGAGGLALALVLFFGIPARRRGWQSLLGLLAVIVILSGSGCGSSNGTGGGGSSTATYTVTITGSSGSMTETTALTVTVTSQ